MFAPRDERDMDAISILRQAAEFNAKVASHTANADDCYALDVHIWINRPTAFQRLDLGLAGR